ncbi:TetR-like C-terminal domain-containing protein [Mycolicibacterium baixiangningiae]|uniref:TetR-like C-terminal domain-containing protein n=1 Tax=Mycolicibacterium baixiangningiae TaxID=2761578 RepID=UPI0018671579|nr:TetR-like C-terminal domain-containing protein [Mycolicibacterium baixiangningiae]
MNARQSQQTPTRHRTASDQVAPALLQAAQTVLDRDGQRGVTIRAVAREAAVAPMSVYNRFGSRDGLLVVLAGRAFAELAGSLVAPADLTPEQRFRQICCGYRTFALTHPERYALIFSIGSPVKLPESQEASDRGNEAFGYLVDAVEDLNPSHAISRGNRNATEAAQIVWNALHGAITIEHANIGRTDNPSDTYEHMITLLLRGLRDIDEPTD